MIMSNDHIIVYMAWRHNMSYRFVIKQNIDVIILLIYVRWYVSGYMCESESHIVHDLMKLL